MKKNIIGPYFFENEGGAAVTVNGDTYRTMLTDFIVPALEDIDVDNVWFQQDGATFHTSHATIDLLHQTFDGRLISRNGNVNWTLRSCDSTLLDFFLRGAVKDKCYADHPEAIEHLKANIRGAIAEILLYTLEKVLENWSDRMGYCEASRGSHMNEIIFHC